LKSEVTVYYDYACGDSHRLKLMLDRLDVTPQWKTVSLKEMRQAGQEESLFDADEIESLSVLALALAHAMRAHDFERFHNELFDAFHEEDRHLTREEILKIAEASGLEVADFESNQRSWLGKLGAEHHDAVQMKNVFGTPTISVDGATPVYVELQEVPASAEAAEAVLDYITRFADAPHLREVKRVPS
jgi:predicted DsbA family dithiol-disulfide isomerase